MTFGPKGLTRLEGPDTDGSGARFRRTEGGEALPEIKTIPAPHAVGGARWYVLWTRSNCEQRVSDQLTTKGLEVFLPKLDIWSRRGGHRYLAQVPMFRGYLFLRHLMDKPTYIEICKSIGLVSILGERWDRLEPVPDSEIGALHSALRARMPVLPHGQRVSIARGPLAGVEGIFVRGNPNKGLLVLSVHMLRRSVAVEVDCTLVAAA
jgi:transcription termination/antitermination protein NusG